MIKKYYKYKDSGVEWIGEIPEHWKESQFKNFIKLRHGFQFRENDFTDFGIKIVKITQLHKDGFLDISNCSTIDETRIDSFKDIIIEENDILMCLTGGTIGKIIKVGKVTEPLLQNYRVGHFSTINCNVMSNDYLFYLMSSQVILGQILYDVRETGQPNIGLEDMNRMRICIPPFPEQHQIVIYLDEKTTFIDTLIEKTQQKIDTLKELRSSLINKVVTKGIDPNVEMKDSGVEWIGEIPKHWDCVNTNKIYNDLGTGTTPTSDNLEYYDEGEFCWVTTTDLNEGIMYDTLTKLTKKCIVEYPNLRLYPSGSIYISMYGGRIGKIGISTFESYCNQSVCVLPENDKIIVKFYYYWFLGFQELVKNMGRGGGQPNINKDMIKQFPTVKIPKIEQHKIVEYLEQQTQLIDTSIQKEQLRIEKLKEYRQSLISDVVTGKIKVTYE